MPTGLLLALQVLTGICGGAGYAAALALLALRLQTRCGPITRAVAAVGQRSLMFYLFNSVLVAVVLHPTCSQPAHTSAAWERSRSHSPSGWWLPRWERGWTGRDARARRTR